MAERPILFSTPLVRAILAGKKTQTRRPVTGRTFKIEPGDRLYVRETWTVETADSGHGPFEWVRFKADIKDALHGEFRWRPSIHMPKRHARLWLRVVNVRVEPLGHMSHDDAMAEGFDNRDHFAAAWETIYGRGAGPDLGAAARIAAQRVHVAEFEVER